MFFGCPFETLGNTAATYGGQNIGAGRPDRLGKGLRLMLLMYNSAFYFLLAVVNTVRFMIQGMGYSLLAVAAGILEMIARALGGSVFVDRYGYPAACMGNPAAWIAADVFLVIAFALILRREKRRVVARE